MRLRVRHLIALCLAAAPVVVAAAEPQSSYTYVKFSLGVPWALYFMFLALVLVPFAVMILLAWRHWFRDAEKLDAE